MVDTDQKFVHVDYDTTHCGVRAVVILSAGRRGFIYQPGSYVPGSPAPGGHTWGDIF